MKTQKNIIESAVNYLSIVATKKPKFELLKYVDISKNNPLKVSYINQDKIDGLLAHTGEKITGTREQRKKHFTETSIFKMLSEIFEPHLMLEEVATLIDSKLKDNFGEGGELFIENDVAGYYSQELKKYDYHKNGSCMEGKPSALFEIYSKFINTEVKIVGLKIGKLAIAKANLYIKTNKDTNKKEYYLDRIYIADFFQPEQMDNLQSRLYHKIKKALRIKRLDCYSLTHIQRGDTNRQTHKDSNKFNYNGSSVYPQFKIQISKENFFSLNKFPYMDTFRYLQEGRENIFLMHSDNEEHEYILDSTAGDYTQTNQHICECCSERVAEDETYYSDIDSEQLCSDCAVYIEEREDYAREEFCTYNNFLGVYHYSSDLNN